MRLSPRLVASSALVAVIASLLTVTASPGPASALPSSRISGVDRYTTSAAASLSAHPSRGSVDTVYLASGENFPAALSAGPAAAQSCEADAGTTWTKYRAAIVARDADGAAALTRFPLLLRGELDESDAPRARQGVPRAPRAGMTHIACQPVRQFHGRIPDWVNELRRARDEHETVLFVAATSGRVLSKVFIAVMKPSLV